MTAYWRRGVLPLTCTVMAAVALTGCSGDRDGDSVARDIAEQHAGVLDDNLGYRSRVRQAEYVAATEIPKELDGGGPGTARLTPLGWSGQTAGSEQATIDVRFDVTVTEQHPPFGGGRGTSAGHAARCYRYVLQLYRYTDYHEIDCPTMTAAPAVPTASPVPRLPDDARKRLSAVLRTTTPDTLAASVRAAFPDKYIAIDTAIHNGALVAAVGVPAERDCLLLVRTPSGDIESPGYDRVWLEPGELGCSTNLFIAPPR